MLVIERVRDKQRTDDAAHDVRAVNARPEQHALQADDDGAAAQRIREALQRRLDNFENALRQRRGANVVEQAVDDGSTREEHHARHERGEGARHALRHGIRHFDGQMVLFAVAEDVRHGERDEDSRDDAVAAGPGLRDDVGHRLAAFGRERRRHDDKEGRQREHRGHHGVTALVLHELVGDGQHHNEGQHAERAAGHCVERGRPVRTEYTRHERCIPRHRQIG